MNACGGGRLFTAPLAGSSLPRLCLLISVHTRLADVSPKEYPGLGVPAAKQ